MYRCTWSWKRLVNERVSICFPWIAPKEMPTQISEWLRRYQRLWHSVCVSAATFITGARGPSWMNSLSRRMPRCSCNQKASKSSICLSSCYREAKRITVKFSIATHTISLTIGSSHSAHSCHTRFLDFCSDFQLSLLPTQIHKQLDSRPIYTFFGLFWNISWSLRNMAGFLHISGLINL